MSGARAILVVDDNAITRKLVRFSLETAGYDVREAATGEAAVASVRARVPDLVLQDLMLPDTDGFELLERLRTVVGRQTPILAFTGLLNKLAESRLGTSGFDDVIAKPIEPTRLREVVRGYFPDAAPRGDAFGSGRVIVLADDDPIQRKLATYRLTRLGFDVIAAEDGAEALALARSRKPDAIVSDVLMPRMDGFELCASVRRDASIASTPVLLLTNSYLEDRDFSLAERVGADAYVVRTPELADLTELLRKALDERRDRTPTIQELHPDVQSDRIERALRQLDRQVAINTSLTQRNAMLSAELAILGGLTGALARQDDVGAALDAALNACFDAGGLSWGVLLTRDVERWERRALGLSAESLRRAGAELEHAAVVAGTDAAADGAPRVVRIPSLHHTEAASEHVLLVPIVHADEVLGALLLGASDGDEHRVAFASVVAGQIASTMALHRTFRALQRATAAEQARVRLLESILDSIDDPIIVVGRDQAVSITNRAAERAGLAWGSVARDRWPDTFRLLNPDGSTPRAWEDVPVVRALAGERVVGDELVVVRGGETRWVSVDARPVVTDDGAIESAVTVVRDVTDEKQAQLRQIQNDRMASIGVLAAGIAHEINNPLAAVLAEIEMALDDSAGTSVEAGLRNALEAADRVRTIVHDLKTLSRGETDDVASVDVRRVLEVAVRLASAETRSRAMVVLDFDEVPRVIANAARLGQVFLNLLVNAAQAIPEGKPSQHRITVRTRAGRDGGVVAEVSDTGSGMTPEVKARLFTPFFTTKPVGVGSGLGLSISHRIVDAAGGRIDVDSAPGAGTTFRVWLPPAAKHARVTSAQPVARSRPRVLVVDEDPLAAQALGRVLREERDVDTDASLDAALARLAAGARYDAVLLDLETCALAPAALLERIGGVDPRLRDRIVLIAHRAEGEVSASAHGAVWLSKPIDTKDVRSMLRALR